MLPLRRSARGRGRSWWSRRALRCGGAGCTMPVTRYPAHPLIQEVDQVPETPSDAVTTVVITRNRLADLLVSVPRHRGPVVVVDNGSDDGTVERLRRLGLPDLTVVPLSRNLGAPARNVGVELARTPYVAFADDDSWWAPGALDRAAAVLAASPRLGLLAGTVLVGPQERLDPVCSMMAASPLGWDVGLPGPEILGFMACGAVVRREAFLQAGRSGRRGLAHAVRRAPAALRRRRPVPASVEARARLLEVVGQLDRPVSSPSPG